MFTTSNIPALDLFTMSVYTLRLKWMFQTGTTGEAGNCGPGNYLLEDNQEDVKSLKKFILNLK